MALRDVPKQQQKHQRPRPTAAACPGSSSSGSCSGRVSGGGGGRSARRQDSSSRAQSAGREDERKHGLYGTEKDASGENARCRRCVLCCDHVAVGIKQANGSQATPYGRLQAPFGSLTCPNVDPSPKMNVPAPSTAEVLLETCEQGDVFGDEAMIANIPRPCLATVGQHGDRAGASGDDGGASGDNAGRQGTTRVVRGTIRERQGTDTVAVSGATWSRRLDASPA